MQLENASQNLTWPSALLGLLRRTGGGVQRSPSSRFKALFDLKLISTTAKMAQIVAKTIPPHRIPDEPVPILATPMYAAAHAEEPPKRLVLGPN